MTALAPSVPLPAGPPAGRPALWHRAPGWVFHGVTAIGAAGLLWSASYPYGSMLLGIVFAWWILACAAVWLVRLIAYVAGRKQPSGRPWPFLIAPVGGILVLAIGLTSLPLHARWTASRGAFDARADALVVQAERADADPGDILLRDDRVALYTVDFAHVDEHGNAFFSIAGSGFIDRGGFARFADEPPADTTGDRFEHLGGDWYLWFDRF